MMALSLALLALVDSATGCFAASRAIRMEESVTSGDVEMVDCEDAAVAPTLRVDPASRQVRARADIAPGQYLGRIWVPDGRSVNRGDSVRVIARIGAVEVSRDVTAVQAARPGQSFFVVDADGHVFAAPPLIDSDGDQ